MHLYFFEKNIKLQLVPPPMPLKVLLIPESLTDSDSDGIDGGSGCNFILCQLLVVGLILKWLPLYVIFSVFTLLTTPMYFISSNLAHTFV